MNRADIVTSTRHAGGVKRYHAWPTLRGQTVAEHSWNVMRIYWELFQDEEDAVNVDVFLYILYHDVAEVGTGDIPFPIKSMHPGLKSTMDELESEVLEGLGVSLPEITPRQRLLVKVCDLLEMWEFGLDEVRMGNTYAKPIVGETRAAVWKLTKGDQKLDSDIYIWIISKENRDG